LSEAERVQAAQIDFAARGLPVLVALVADFHLQPVRPCLSAAFSVIQPRSIVLCDL
jgi:hypothetical protein